MTPELTHDEALIMAALNAVEVFKSGSHMDRVLAAITHTQGVRDALAREPEAGILPYHRCLTASHDGRSCTLRIGHAGEHEYQPPSRDDAGKRPDWLGKRILVIENAATTDAMRKLRDVSEYAIHKERQVLALETQLAAANAMALERQREVAWTLDATKARIADANEAKDEAEHDAARYSSALVSVEEKRLALERERDEAKARAEKAEAECARIQRQCNDHWAEHATRTARAEVELQRVNGEALLVIDELHKVVTEPLGTIYGPHLLATYAVKAVTSAHAEIAALKAASGLDWKARYEEAMELLVSEKSRADAAEARATELEYALGKSQEERGELGARVSMLRAELQVTRGRERTLEAELAARQKEAGGGT